MPNETSSESDSTEKLRILKDEIEKGLADIRAGRVYEWDMKEFLRRSRISKPVEK
jgi:predicted transcriptional regulator